MCCRISRAGAQEQVEILLSGEGIRTEDADAVLAQTKDRRIGKKTFCSLFWCVR